MTSTGIMDDYIGRGVDATSCGVNARGHDRRRWKPIGPALSPSCGTTMMTGRGPIESRHSGFRPVRPAQWGPGADHQARCARSGDMNMARAPARRRRSPVCGHISRGTHQWRRGLRRLFSFQFNDVGHRGRGLSPRTATHGRAPHWPAPSRLVDLPRSVPIARLTEAEYRQQHHRVGIRTRIP